MDHERSNRPGYTNQDSPQTLREGLAEYHVANPGLLDPLGMPAEAAALFRQHDAAHVLFGCDTSVRGEALVDTWTIFGSSIGLRGYLAYLRLPQVNQVFAEVGRLRILAELLRCAPDVARVTWRSRRMARAWPWQEWEQRLDRPLGELREEFGIRVV
jgi:ubiquinone biosynthesis protein Coq4